MTTGMANATPTATRTLPAEVPADRSFSVEIEVSDYGTVVETLPEEFSYMGSSLDPTAVKVYGPNTIEFKLAKAKYFTYYVALRYHDIEEGTYTFSGVLRDRKGEEYEISGDAEIVVKSATGQFDTGSPVNPYPSIFGTHTGTVTPSQTITVQKLYTYPCPGTGGHAESIELYENDTLIANGTWNGYKGDWHKIWLNSVAGTPYVTLLKDPAYCYIIRTSSYPVIIHETTYNATGGTITCTDFTDANGKRYFMGWIPAIRFE
jgi:hypothetical protein